MKVLVEMTDTWGGDPNYGWTRRHVLDLPDTLSTLAGVRRAKAVLDMQGTRCARWDDGTTITLRPHAWSRIIFINFLS